MKKRHKQLLAAMVIATLMIVSAGTMMAIRRQPSIAAGESTILTFVCDASNCVPAIGTPSGNAVICNADGMQGGTGHLGDTYFQTMPATAMQVKFNAPGSVSVTCDVLSGTSFAGAVLFSESRIVEVQEASQVTCTNECQDVGKWKCIDDISFKRCGDFDSDPCYEWSPIIESCLSYSSNYHCIDDRCQMRTDEPDIPGPSPQCTPGWKCGDNNFKYELTSSCTHINEEFCPYGCAFGSCLLPPDPDEEPPQDGDTVVVIDPRTGVPILVPKTCIEQDLCINYKKQCVQCPEGVPPGTLVMGTFAGSAAGDFCATIESTLGLSCLTFGIILILTIIVIIVSLVVILW